MSANLAEATDDSGALEIPTRFEIKLPALPAELRKSKETARLAAWTLLGATVTLVATKLHAPLEESLIAGGVFVAIGLIDSLFVGQRDRRKKAAAYGTALQSEVRQLEVRVATAGHEKEKVEDDLRRLKAGRDDVRKQVEDLQQQLENPPIGVVERQAYARCLEEWNASGAGELLLYNIELQSFQDADSIRKAWGRLGQWTNMKRIRLLLSPERVRRWEQVVQREEHGFFADENHRRFEVAELRDAGSAGAPLGIGFALYHRLDAAAGEPTLHPRVLVFVLSEPFSEPRTTYGVQATGWWDYRLILQATGVDTLLKSCERIWQAHASESESRGVGAVLEDTKPLVPVPDVEQLLRELRVSAADSRVVLDQLRPRVLKRSPDRLPSGVDEKRVFIEYQNAAFRNDLPHEHVIAVRCTGMAAQPRPAIVWVGGFTERTNTRLSQFFQGQLRSDEVVQVHYQASHRIEHVNVSGCMEDMRQVLDFVIQQDHVVEPRRIVLCARSINALAATLVLAEPRYLRHLAGIILVSPVFDIRQTIRGFREACGHRGIGVETAWRRRGRVFDSDFQQNKWLRFFGRDVSWALFADIMRHDPDRFSLDAFVEGVSTIAEQCPVAILSNSSDPVTGSAEARQRLEAMASGSGHLRSERYRFIEMRSSHLPPDKVQRDLYPFIREEESREVRRAMREMLSLSGLPLVTDDEDPRPANGSAPAAPKAGAESGPARRELERGRAAELPRPKRFAHQDRPAPGQLPGQSQQQSG